MDDDPDVQALTSLALMSLGGYNVRSCNSARQALQDAPSFRPDLILLDVMMPGTDGLGAFKALRQLDATTQTPVVFMTARTQPQEVAEYNDLGCLGVVVKPFDPVALPETLETMWGRRTERRRDAGRREFESLRRLYLEELPQRITAMLAATDVVATRGWDRATVESLYRDAHRLAGSAGLYGLTALGRTAGALEELLKRLVSGSTWPPASAPGELTTFVKAVARSARKETRRTGSRACARGDG